GQAIASAWQTGTRTTLASGSLRGDDKGVRFGEEIVGLGDLNGDAQADLFLGDIVGGGAGSILRPRAGTAHVVFSAAELLSGEHQLEQLRSAGRLFEVVGAQGGDITGDTAVAGDFDGDGVADVAIASPHASRAGRNFAGMVHVIFGGQRFPALLDLAAPNAPELRWEQLLGAHGNDGLGQGDILGYSAASADLDGDGITDLMLNEMTGDGPAGVDTGNLVVISGRALRSEP
ncbi:MAG: FG-GAP repeat protein, partial [Myxococcales bacterium]|nr:FG-GAP repeat protein [Myxococcales bacterium]